MSKNLKGEPFQTLAGTLWRTLPDDLFYRCEKLTYVDLNGAKVEGIGQYAFYRCMELTTITGLTTSPGVLVVPEGVTLVGQHAFGECKGLTSASLPSTLMRIYMGSNIFSGCENLRTAVINETAGTSLPSGIFYNCKKLDSVTLPGNLTSIGSGAFRDCNALKEVRFGGSQEQWYAVTASEGNDILETLTYAGKVIYSAPPVTGQWEGTNGLGWQYRTETGRLSYTKSGYGPADMFVAFYDSKGRLLSVGKLTSPDDHVTLPSGAATVKMFLLDVGGAPDAEPLRHRRRGPEINF